MTARLCHLPHPEPGQHARLEVDLEVSCAWTAWPAQLVMDQHRYLHLGHGTYLRWQLG